MYLCCNIPQSPAPKDEGPVKSALCDRLAGASARDLHPKSLCKFWSWEELRATGQCIFATLDPRCESRVDPKP